MLFKGRSIKGLKPHRIGALGIARTYQIVKPFPHMTVLENIAVGAMFGKRDKRRGARQAREAAAEIASFVGLEKHRDRPADQLNVASRKRLEIAKALAMSPEVILFDEVMAGLNPREIDQAVELIQQIRARGIFHHRHRTRDEGDQGDQRPPLRPPARRKDRRRPPRRRCSTTRR